MASNLIISDTNCLIDLFHQDLLTIKIFEKINPSNIIISSISVMELLIGSRNNVEKERIKKKISYYHIVHLNEDISELAITLVDNYYLSHHLLLPDALIAATAIVTGFQLFTYNTKDFKYIPNIKLYEY